MQQLESEFLQSGGNFQTIKLQELFTVKGNPQLNKESFTFSETGEYPYFTRTVLNNGIAGYVEYLDDEHKITGNCLAVGMLGMQFFYMQKDFYAGQFTKSVYPKKEKISRFNAKIAQYFIAILNRYQMVFQGMLVRDFEKTFYNSEIELPFKNEVIDVEYIEMYMRKLQKERVRELQLYLKATGLSNYNLTDGEKMVIGGGREWQKFNLKQLFGSATRGKRLKSSDRIIGNLPFVTAGEADTGISAFIGNETQIFSKNTITIDMFGSAKYRNYDYGADDHIAVVHTQELDKHAVLFITSAIHKVANAGQFSYSRNFYAKDADELKILLPVKDNQPDYDYMATYIKAIQKLVIKGVVDFADREMQAYQQAIGEN